ncbi:hypothetical protein KZZ52_44260 [Dactylosporangium sp. AC04546]|uniref:hypothetical protein n=1 Tax=Dactylosporangium sp. AC04546 TaxID=2862460 RepID=UPI001EDEC6F1|nr:hypothetical protein [Dactylosporangium sp. AC04546]WVK80931.1 hypothetical protein KZZ52_44260 [Dactylosporangium sp. AC04546]
MGNRPRVAVLCTVYFKGSHADVIVGRLLDGYRFGGAHQDARIEVASVYLEQLGSHDFEPISRIDIGTETLRAHGIPMFKSVGEAISLGGSGVNVDGVLIIGEHGDYGWGEFEQKLYPRRRMFDASVAAMVAGGRTVPIFVDKHLAWSFTDAASMVADADRLGIPLLAGSSLPLAWRTPTGANWPYGAPISEAVVAGIAATEPGCRPTEMNGFHDLEFAQALLERRSGGETGVATVTAVTGAAVEPAIVLRLGGSDLFAAAVGALGIDTDDPIGFARSCANDLFLIEYLDGTSLTVVNFDLHAYRAAIAVRGPDKTVVTSPWLDEPDHGHFTFLVRQIESLVLTGISPYPVTRTLLTTGVIEAALRSRREKRLVPTPHLSLRYTAPQAIPDTGIDEDQP